MTPSVPHTGRVLNRWYISSSSPAASFGVCPCLSAPAPTIRLIPGGHSRREEADGGLGDLLIRDVIRAGRCRWGSDRALRPSRSTRVGIPLYRTSGPSGNLFSEVV